MDELAVIDIYRELKKKYQACYDNMTKDEQNELGLLLKDLKKRATEVGIDVEDPNANGGEIDNQSDILELIAISKTDDDIRDYLKQEIQKSKNPPSKRIVFDLIQVLDKYYAANVDTVSSGSVRKNLEDMPTFEYFVDKDALVKAFHDSARDAIKSILQKGDSLAWKTSISALHKEFDAFFKKRQKLLETTKTSVGLGTQWSIGLKDKVFFDRDWVTLSGSAAAEFLVSQNDIITKTNVDKKEYSETNVESWFKQSANTKLSSLANKDFSAKYSTTILTYSNTVDLVQPWLDALEDIIGVPTKITYAFKFIGISGGNPFSEASKSNVPKFKVGITLFTIQIKLQILTADALKKAFDLGDFPIKKFGNFDLNLSLAIKWTPSFIDKLDDWVAKKAAKPKNTDPKPKNKLSNVEKDELKKMRKYAAEIDVEADNISKNLDAKKTANTKLRLDLDKKNATAATKIRNNTKFMKESAEKLYTPGGKALGKEILEETGEKIVTKLGTKLAGKVILKFIPGLNVISTAMDLYELGTALWSWWNSEPELPTFRVEVDPHIGTIDRADDHLTDPIMRESYSDGHRFKTIDIDENGNDIIKDE